MKRIRKICPILLAFYIATVGYICFSTPDMMPQMEESLWGFPVDKIVHFLMFTPFVFLSFNSLRKREKKSGALVTLTYLTSTGLVFAGLTEIIQMAIPERSAELADYIADCCGLLSGSVFTYSTNIFGKYEH